MIGKCDEIQILAIVKFSEEANASLQNANTISYTTTSPSEQIDNAELQEKENVSTGDLDANENDKETKTADGTNATSAPIEKITTPVETDLNNGTFTDES